MVVAIFMTPNSSLILVEDDLYFGAVTKDKKTYLIFFFFPMIFHLQYVVMSLLTQLSQKMLLLHFLHILVEQIF